MSKEIKFLNEWMADKKPGEIKLVPTNFAEGFWFSPYFKCKDDIWHGLTRDNNEASFHGSYQRFYLYVEKTKTKSVVVWDWLGDDVYLVTGTIGHYGGSDSGFVKIPGTERAIQVPESE